MSRSVYVTRAVPDATLAALQSLDARVDVNPHDRPLTAAELRSAVRGHDALVALLTDRVDGDLLDAAGPQLRIVANFAVGHNNIDLAAAAERGVIVTNTPGVLDDATATLAMTLILATARRVVEADAYLRAGKWTTGWAPNFFVGLDVDRQVLGIAGLGRIGKALARRARAFDMTILYASRSRDEAFEAETGARQVDKDTLLREADFVSLHVPLTGETSHYIGARELGLMKRSAVLINTARGPVVDEAALVEALRSRSIAGAGLDVFEDEPLLALGLTALNNVVLLPHIGSATAATRDAMGAIVVENVRRVLNDEAPLTPVTLAPAGT